MQFIHTKYRPDEMKHAQGVCYLSDDNWDDFTFRTTFIVTLFDYTGGRYDLGAVKIIKKGMSSGRTDLGDMAGGLGQNYCSLGNDRDYYIRLSGIHGEAKHNYLAGLRDCVSDHSIWNEFRAEPAMGKSLLRSVSVRDVEFNFPRILQGHAELTPYAFDYHLGEFHQSYYSFEVTPGSMPPSNIHVIIGKNGVGKTRLLAGMADSLTENKAASIGLPGKFLFHQQQSDAETDFLNLVVVSYSVFDRFDPIPDGTERTKHGVPYHYVGIKKFNELSTEEVILKTTTDINKEFERALMSMLSDFSRIERWIKAIEILESDPGIRQLNLSNFIEQQTDVAFAQATEQFASLSSGHKIVLLTITKLVEFVSDRSLILLDEPETHLHPPLLGSFIRVLSELLVARNAVAIIATHSPVVLQEVPSTCVSIMHRSGEVIRVDRPDIETFAENVSVLTRKVFGLEVEESGFFKLLKDRAKGKNFIEIMHDFGEQIGTEGRAIVRALIKDSE